MSAESLLQDIVLKLDALHRKVDELKTEKALNEDFGYLQAMKEAKKGNRKALKEYFNNKGVS